MLRRSTSRYQRVSLLAVVLAACSALMMANHASAIAASTTARQFSDGRANARLVVTSPPVIATSPPLVATSPPLVATSPPAEQ